MNVECSSSTNSLLFGITGPMDKMIQVQNICTGNFDENGSLYYYNWEGFHLYTKMGYGICLLISLLMVAVKIGRYQMDKKDHNPNLIPKTKDLESILLNFTLVIQTFPKKDIYI